MLRILILILITYALKCLALYKSHPDITELHPDTFIEKVINNDEVWIVEFYAPWCPECIKFLEEYENIARALKGLIKVGALNGDQYPLMRQKYNVEGYPAIKIFSGNKFKPEVYGGEFKAENVLQEVIKAVERSVFQRLSYEPLFSYDSLYVRELNYQNFDLFVMQSYPMWLVQFYSSNDRSRDIAAYWIEAATKLKGRANFGTYNISENNKYSKIFAIDKYPTILYFLPGAKSLALSNRYSGSIKTEDLVSWVTETLPPPSISQLINMESLLTSCATTDLCIMTVLPKLKHCKSVCRNNYLNNLRKLAIKFRRFFWGWVWSEAGKQPHLENVLPGNNHIYPIMAAVNVRELKLTMYNGTFSLDKLYFFLYKVSMKKAVMVQANCTGIPQVLKVEPWNGQDPRENDLVWTLVMQNRTN